MAQILLCAWIADGRIYSRDPVQDGKFWIDENNWIWGPVGAADVTTGHWIQDDGWIIGPGQTLTGYFVHGEWIQGPRVRLPFADQGP